jgi:cell division protein FtsX
MLLISFIVTTRFLRINFLYEASWISAGISLLSSGFRFKLVALFRWAPMSLWI